MLIIWGRKTSSNVQALMWCVGELGLDHVRHDVGGRFGGTDDPAFLAMNPNGTIPVLRDGDGPALWETGSILRYLSTVYGDEEFWPSDPLARADVDQWAEWAKLNVAMKFTVPVFWSVVRTLVENRDGLAIQKAVEELERCLAIAEQKLSRHAFLAGDHFTLADIQFGHVLYRYFDIDIPRADLPALARYYDRLAARPAFAEHVMVSYEELKAS